MFSMPDDDDQSNQFAEASSRKRSSKACDQCRRTKGKCELSEDGQTCRGCIGLQTDCTWSGPAHKRGPPKGYIQALEQRWYQSEAVLGAILSNPQVQTAVSALTQDSLAREVLERVSSGPFGTWSSESPPPDWNSVKDVFQSAQRLLPRPGARRSNRQSRASREIVSSSQENPQSPLEISEWRQHLANLMSNTLHTEAMPSADFGIGPAGPTFHNRITMPNPSYSSAGSGSNYPAMLEITQPDALSFYPAAQGSDPPRADEDEEKTYGQLSLNDSGETRYHGKASGLYIVARQRQYDRANVGAAWTFPPMPHDLHFSNRDESEIDVNLPPVDVQTQLLGIYFTYIHPIFPVLHKQHFFEAYNLRAASFFRADPHADDSSKVVSKLLLLTIFSLAERLGPRPDAHIDVPTRKSEYLLEAQRILSMVYMRSRISTCQALLLLGLHSFTDATETSWLHAGLASRMALDLGLNRNLDCAAEWFTSVEKQARRRTWWACYVFETIICAITGRPGDANGPPMFDVPLPEIDAVEDLDPWQLHPSHSLAYNLHPLPCRISSYLRSLSTLVLIIHDILCRLYPIAHVVEAEKRASAMDLVARLNHWLANLPLSMGYDTRANPLPHVLVLHMMYWYTLLLLHRSFLHIGGSSMTTSGGRHPDLPNDEHVNTSQSAASHISVIAHDFQNIFGLDKAPPLIVPLILNAGMTHVVILDMRPMNTTCSEGLDRCLYALEWMKGIWASAEQAHRLLIAAKAISVNASSSDLPADQGENRVTGSSPLPGASNAWPAWSTETEHGGTLGIGEILGLEIPEYGSRNTRAWQSLP